MEIVGEHGPEIVHFQGDEERIYPCGGCALSLLVESERGKVCETCQRQIDRANAMVEEIKNSKSPEDPDTA